MARKTTRRTSRRAAPARRSYRSARPARGYATRKVARVSGRSRRSPAQTIRIELVQADPNGAGAISPIGLTPSPKAPRKAKF